MEEETFVKALQQYTLKQLKDFKEWLKPDPTDSLLVKIGKGILKSFVVLLLIAFSPVIIVFLIAVFIGVL